MYYEDIGIYVDKDTTHFNTENPVVRDELWARYGGYEDDYDDGYYHEVYVHIEFNISGLPDSTKTEIEGEVARVYPNGEYISYVDENGNDTGDRDIYGYTDQLTYEDVLDVLIDYELEFTDLTK